MNALVQSENRLGFTHTGRALLEFDCSTEYVNTSAFVGYESSA
jgi:hypothetical protein